MINQDCEFSLEKMKKLAQEENGLIFLIQNDALEPNFLSKDTVYIQWFKPELLKLGDLVLVLLALQTPAILRIVKIRKKSDGYFFTVKADNKLFADLEIPTSQLIGKVIKQERACAILKERQDIEKAASLWRLRRLAFRGIEVCKILFFDNLCGVLLYLFRFPYRSMGEGEPAKLKKIVYREARQEDALSIAKLMRHYHWEKHFKKIKRMYEAEIKNGSNYFVVAESDSKIVGVYLLRKFGISFEGYNIFSPGIIYVYWKYRKYGVGSNLKIFMWREKLKDFQRIKIIASGYEKVIFKFHFGSKYLNAVKLPMITESMVVETHFDLSVLSSGRRCLITILIDRNKPLNNPPQVKILGRRCKDIEARMKKLFLGQNRPGFLSEKNADPAYSPKN